MALLLVSVRDADEAHAALSGGAGLIDVKEPARGPLGRADFETWCAVREVVPASIPLSFALGELPELEASLAEASAFTIHPWPSVAYLKLGLAEAGADWRERWRKARAEIQTLAPAAAWVAVIYTDWQAAQAPEPRAVFAEALHIPECKGYLLDSWDKSHPAIHDLDLGWLITALRYRGHFLAVAGGLVLGSLDRVAALEPDIIAVRGAACHRGRRTRSIDADRVAALAREAGALPTSFRFH